MQIPDSPKSPSVRVILSHFMVGGLVWFGVSLLLMMFPDELTTHYFSPALLALTHLLVLGWITMIIFGALYQIIPVILDVNLYRESLALLTIFLLLPGTLLLSMAFWLFRLDYLLLTGATLIALAVICFSINIFMTAGRSTKTGIERDFILTATLWLIFTVAAGITLALNLRLAFLPVPHLSLLHIHAHAGLAGWFLQLIIGVSSRLLPMFFVAHQLDRRDLSRAYYLINGALFLGIISLYLQWSAGIRISVVSGVAGIIFFLSFLLQAYRKRARKQLDAGMQQSVFSFGLLILSLLMLFLVSGFVTGFPPPALAVTYGISIILGFITSLIMGQTFKTLPFIVWLKKYRHRVGREKVPMPKDLYSEKMVKWQLAFFGAGFLILLSGVLLSNPPVIRAGAALLFLSSALYNINIFKIVFQPPGAGKS